MGCDEIIILSKLSQFQEEKYCVFSISCGSGLRWERIKGYWRNMLKIHCTHAQKSIYKSQWNINLENRNKIHIFKEAAFVPTTDSDLVIYKYENCCPTLVDCIKPVMRVQFFFQLSWFPAQEKTLQSCRLCVPQPAPICTPNQEMWPLRAAVYWETGQNGTNPWMPLENNRTALRVTVAR